MLQKRIDDQPSISRESMRAAEAIFLQHLRRVGLKQTGQRNTILRTFLETREHLSTDELHRLVKKKIPASDSPPSIARSNFSLAAAWRVKSLSMTASRATNTNTTAAAITTWCVRSAARR